VFDSLSALHTKNLPDLGFFPDQESSLVDWATSVLPCQSMEVMLMLNRYELTASTNTPKRVVLAVAFREALWIGKPFDRVG